MRKIISILLITLSFPAFASENHLDILDLKSDPGKVVVVYESENGCQHRLVTDKNSLESDVEKISSWLQRVRKSNDCSERK